MINSPIKNQQLFWDYDLDSIDKDMHASFIIARVLEFGSLDDIRWILSEYDKRLIIDTIKHTRLISRKTALFWKLIFNINEEILCLSDQYQTTQKMLWKK